MIKLTFEFNTKEEAVTAIEKIYTTHYGDKPAPAPPAPPAPAAPTPEELNQAMVEVSTRLNDNGAACQAIIQATGATGIAAMTDKQRTDVMIKVRAL